MAASVVDQYGFFQFAIMHCALDEAVAHIRAQLDAWKHRPYQVEQGRLDVRRIVLSGQGPHKLPSVCKGCVLFEVSGRDGVKTLFASSVSDGAHSLLVCLSSVIPKGVLGFRVEDLRRQYPANIVYQHQNFETTRLVRVMKEDRWDYFEQGKPLWFESVELYKARVRKDRLNPEILSGYIDKIGYGSLDGSFWTNPSVVAAYIIEDGFTPWSGGAGVLDRP